MMTSAKTTLLLILLTVLSINATFSPPLVTTPTCTFVGRTVLFRRTPVHAFLGIPFARPPVGELRFRKPQPSPCPPTRLVVADRTRAACVQNTGTPFPWRDDLPGKDLDCLHLNVWTPAAADNVTMATRAVMVFLHGGGFRIGSNRIDFYDGRAMAALGDVVVVVPNYRLGPEGFMYFGTDEAPGNMGLHDIVVALQWVRDNIGAFGGDPGRVTLFGQSSGAIAAGMLTASPLTSGLFGRAVLQSGSPANLDAEDNGRDGRLSEDVARDVGCEEGDVAEVIACLRGKDPFELAKSIGRVSDNPQRGLYPRYGDDILPGGNVREALIRGDFRDMPVLAGTTTDEGATMVTKVYEEVFGFYGDKDYFVNRTFGEQMVRENFKRFADPDAVVEYYLGDAGEDEEVSQRVFNASGDLARVCPTVYFGEAFAAEGNPVFYYVFEQRPTPSPFHPSLGVVHFDETPFVFGHPLRRPQNYTQEEQRLSLRMLRAWTNFAKTGIPWTNWPLFSRDHPNYVALRADRSRIEYTPAQSCDDFFRPYFGFT